MAEGTLQGSHRRTPFFALGGADNPTAAAKAIECAGEFSVSWVATRSIAPQERRISFPWMRRTMESRPLDKPTMIAIRAPV